MPPHATTNENGDDDEDSHDAADYDEDDENLGEMPAIKSENGIHERNGHDQLPDVKDEADEDECLLFKSIKQLELDLRNEEAKLVLLKRLYYSQKYPTQANQIQQSKQDVLKQQHAVQQQQHMKQQQSLKLQQQQLHQQQQRGTHPNRNQMDIMNKNRKVSARTPTHLTGVSLSTRFIPISQPLNHQQLNSATNTLNRTSGQPLGSQVPGKQQLPTKPQTPLTSQNGNVNRTQPAGNHQHPQSFVQPQGKLLLDKQNRQNQSTNSASGKRKRLFCQISAILENGFRVLSTPAL
jgi:hypothetical protein